LAVAGLPPLWIPSPDSFHRVEAIPLLGTGKLDLKRLKELAIAEFSAASK
jgi:acyl-[acyl-carrier-protein]-phospholipid O-acyltransferase/long-chain-fatty-acid--[acyl-carrier-protein] ligase